MDLSLLKIDEPLFELFLENLQFVIVIVFPLKIAPPSLFEELCVKSHPSIVKTPPQLQTAPPSPFEEALLMNLQFVNVKFPL